MSQTAAAQMPAAVDYERTLVLAIELSNKSWVLAAQVPGLPHTKAKRTIDPEAEALLAAIAGYRARAAAMGRGIERVIAFYEAANRRRFQEVELWATRPNIVPLQPLFGPCQRKSAAIRLDVYLVSWNASFSGYRRA